MDIGKIWQIMIEYAAGFGMQLLKAIIVFFLGLKIIKIIKNITVKSLERAGKLDKAVISFIVSVTRIALTIGLIVLIVGIFDIETVSFAAVLGAAGLAIGLALQGSLSNFAGGFLILILKPFRPGDFIEVKGTMGTVEDMDIFYTKLKTFDNKRVVIPNSIIINNTLTNFTEKDERRIDINVGVAYDSDIKKVKETISEVISSNDFLMDMPIPIVRLGEMADSALIFHIRVWCKTENYWNAYYGLNEEVKEALDRNNISIPFPQMDLHMIDK